MNPPNDNTYLRFRIEECSQPVAPTQARLVGSITAPYIIGTRYNFVCNRCYEMSPGGGTMLCTTVRDRITWDITGFCNSRHSFYTLYIPYAYT